MKVNWLHALLFAIVVILLYDKACNVPVVSHVENSPIVLHDTMYITKWDTFYTPEKIVYKYLTKKDSIPLVEFSETADDETNLTILKDYFSIRESRNCYDFKEGQFNTVILTHQNESKEQVSFTPYNFVTSKNVTSPPNFEMFTGLHLSNIPSHSSLDLSLTIRHKRNLISGGWSLNGHGFSLGWERKIF